MKMDWADFDDTEPDCGSSNSELFVRKAESTGKIQENNKD